MNFGHHKLIQHMPVISDWDKSMFLSSLHDENDSALPRDVDRFKFVPLTTQKHQFKKDFNGDVDLIRRLWTDA